MKLIVQSFSDIITNSSSEVFVSTINDSLIEALKQLDIDYTYIADETCLRKLVETENWRFTEVVDFNPYSEWWFASIENDKTPDEIWEFFKLFYIDLIGKVIVDVDRDYLYRKENKHNIHIGNFIKE
jgi:hypothetical protein